MQRTVLNIVERRINLSKSEYGEYIIKIKQSAADLRVLFASAVQIGSSQSIAIFGILKRNFPFRYYTIQLNRLEQRRFEMEPEDYSLK